MNLDLHPIVKECRDVEFPIPLATSGKIFSLIEAHVKQIVDLTERMKADMQPVFGSNDQTIELQNLLREMAKAHSVANRIILHTLGYHSLLAYGLADRPEDFHVQANLDAGNGSVRFLEELSGINQLICISTRTTDTSKPSAQGSTTDRKCSIKNPSRIAP
jgi:hypothetical protein